MRRLPLRPRIFILAVVSTIIAFGVAACLEPVSYQLLVVFQFCSISLFFTWWWRVLEVASEQGPTENRRYEFIGRVATVVGACGWAGALGGWLSNFPVVGPEGEPRLHLIQTVSGYAYFGGSSVLIWTAARALCDAEARGRSGLKIVAGTAFQLFMLFFTVGGLYRRLQNLVEAGRRSKTDIPNDI